MGDVKGFSRIKLPARASMWYLAISLAGKGIGFFTTPILTRLLGGEDYGKFSLYMTMVGGISVITSAISSGSAVYKGLRDHSEEDGKYIRSILLLNSAFSLFICILLFTFSDFPGIKPLIFLPLTLQILCDGVVATMMTQAKFHYDYKSVAALTLLGSVLPPLISILLLLSVGGGYITRIYSLLFVSLWVALYSITRLIKGDGGVDRRMLLYVARGSAPLLPHGFSQALSSQADKFILGSLLGASALGKYSVVYTLGVSLQFIITSVGSALNPWIVRKLESGRIKEISRLVTPMFLGFSALSLCVIAGGPEALTILAPRDYFDAFPALLPLVLSCPFFFISSVVTVGLVQSGKGRYSVMLSLTSAVLCVILNYTLIGAFGYFGAGLAILLCRIFEAFVGMILFDKGAGECFIPVKNIAITALWISAVGAILFLLKNVLWARVLLLCVPATILLYCLGVAKSLVLEKDIKIGS